MHLRQEGTPTPRRRPAPGDEHSQRLFPGGPFPSNLPKTPKSIDSASTRGSGLPYAPLAVGATAGGTVAAATSARFSSPIAFQGRTSLLLRRERSTRRSGFPA